MNNDVFLRYSTMQRNGNSKNDRENPNDCQRASSSQFYSIRSGNDHVAAVNDTPFQ